MKTILKLALIAIVGLLVAAPTVAQTYHPPGYYVNWTINLHSPSVTGASGTAQYVVIAPSIHPSPSLGQQKGVAKLSVECEYLTFPDLTPLDVFVGPGTAPNEPFGKFIGTMQVKDGSAAFLSLRPPVVKQGSTVLVARTGPWSVRGTLPVTQGKESSEPRSNVTSLPRAGLFYFWSQAFAAKLTWFRYACAKTPAHRDPPARN